MDGTHRGVGPFIDHLGSVHSRTRRLIVCIPPDRLEWAPASGRFTLGDLVRHLAGIERYMYGETVQGNPSRYNGHGRDLADGFDPVLAYYDHLHEASVGIFAALDDAALQRKCTTPAGTAITTWKWLRAMIEHEAHHRGQMYLMLGILGVPTPPLYGLTSDEVQARSMH